MDNRTDCFDKAAYASMFRRWTAVLLCSICAASVLSACGFVSTDSNGEETAEVNAESPEREAYAKELSSGWKAIDNIADRNDIEQATAALNAVARIAELERHLVVYTVKDPDGVRVSVGRSHEIELRYPDVDLPSAVSPSFLRINRVRFALHDAASGLSVDEQIRAWRGIDALARSVLESSESIDSSWRKALESERKADRNRWGTGARSPRRVGIYFAAHSLMMSSTLHLVELIEDEDEIERLKQRWPIFEEMSRRGEFYHDPIP